jgi:hypothetical protein
MNYQQVIILIIIILITISCVRNDETFTPDYKVYGQPLDSMIPTYQYRMDDWMYPYEWAYTANNYPLLASEPTEQETAPMGACLTENALWTCSL